MSFRLFPSLQELAPAPRRFLFFSMFNVISWQCLVGPALVLFGRHIGMPASWIGCLISFMPLSMLLVMVTVPLVERYGPRQLMLKTWLARVLSGSVVFLVPWVMAQWGTRAGWYMLMFMTLSFCLARAIGVGGWFPWLHEIVPPGQRGVYFSAETTVTQIVNVGVALLLASILSGHASMPAYLGIYAVGIGAGLVSLIWMGRIPGGRAAPATQREGGPISSFLRTLADRSYTRFVLQSSAGFCCVSWLGASTVLYMRDQLKFSDQAIMFVMGATSVGVALTIRSWARYADRRGSARAMALSLTGYALAALSFLTLAPGSRWSPYLLWPAAALAAVFSAAFSLAANRGMLCLLKETGRVGYSNLWNVGGSMAFGLTPIVVGQVIDRWDLWGFRLCFLVSGCFGLLCAVSNLWIPEDRQPLAPQWSQLLRPMQPLRTLGRIVWITAGLDDRRADSERLSEPKPMSAHGRG